MRFDYYSATFEGSPHPLWECLSDRIGGLRSEEIRPHYGYAFARRFEGSGGLLVTTQWGGRQDRVHAFASGAGSPRFASLIREILPGHRLTRADVCIDVVEPGAFDRLKPVCRAVADAHRVRVRKIDDDDRGQDGRTFYCGAPSSQVRTRLYEKGRQVIESGGAFYPPEGLDLAQLRDWVRLETQVRPEGESRHHLAHAEPSEFWGASAWTRELVKAVLDLNVNRVVVGTAWRPADDERAYRHMVAQYGAMLARLALDLGSWDCVGATIGHDVQEQARLKRATRGRG